MDRNEPMPGPRNTTLEEMTGCVARFAELRGSEEAFVDSRLPGCRRRKINLIGSGVTERADLPELAPNIPLPAHGFNLGVYRGFRYVGEGRGTLLTLIGGPDAGKVEWTPEVYEKANKTGLSRDAAGNLRIG